ncbi:MAG: hypothetical protein ACYDAY_03260 [Candidatus Dormibacteria bacterium]
MDTDMGLEVEVAAGRGLATLNETQLEGLVEAARRRESQVRLEMRPFEERLAVARAEVMMLVTEQRRRQRSEHVERRRWVRAQVDGNDFPSVEEVVATTAGPGDTEAVGARRWFLGTGGEVQPGYPNSSRQALTFTDGTTNHDAHTFGDARRLWSEGLSLGTAVKPGVRVHFPGTRQEKLVEPGELFVGPAR